MASTDGLVPTLIDLAEQREINQVVLVDPNVESFEELATLFYQSLRPNIPEFYLEQGERHITKMWVQWGQNDSRFFPDATDIVQENMRAVFRLLAIRGGIDMVHVWLNPID